LALNFLSDSEELKHTIPAQWRYFQSCLFSPAKLYNETDFEFSSEGETALGNLGRGDYASLLKKNQAASTI
jgi:hypothetical protein